MQACQRLKRCRYSPPIACNPFSAILAGVVLMVLGMGLSVTMVLLPVGIPVGLIGLGVFIWGMTPGWRR
jgi:hypothetical protein